MIAAVLDTNVLASGIAGFAHRASPPGQILRAWRHDLFELIVSEHILDELARTLQAPYFLRRLTHEQIAQVLVLLRSQGALTDITSQVHGVASHPEDDLILATAASAKADYLVTGDGKLQRLGGSRGWSSWDPTASWMSSHPRRPSERSRRWP